MERIHPGTANQGAMPVIRALLPNLSVFELANVVIGGAQRLAELTKGASKVLLELLGHLGFHSDRVWCSEPRLAALANCSIKTVQRTIRLAKEKLGLRVIEDPDELLAGPGPQDYSGEREGDGPVNCYDLSAMRALIPRPLIEMYEALVSEKKIRVRPFAKSKPKFDPVIDQPDPFADPVTDPAPVSDSAASSSISFPTSQPAAPLCNVGKRSGEQGSQEGREAIPEPERSQERPSPTARRSPFSGTKMSAVNTRYGPEKRPETTGKPAAARRLSAYEKAAVAAAQKRGIDSVVGRRIVLDRGAEWLLKLLDYGEFCGRRDGDEKGGGWLVNTWKDWVAWSTGFEKHLEREKRAKEQIVAAQEAAAVRNALKVVSAAVERSAPVPPPMPSTGADLLEGVSEADRLRLLDQARQEIRRDMPGLAIKLVDRMVPARIKAILEREKARKE